jgi:hypothetical protein
VLRTAMEETVAAGTPARKPAAMRGTQDDKSRFAAMVRESRCSSSTASTKMLAYKGTWISQRKVTR